MYIEKEKLQPSACAIFDTPCAAQECMSATKAQRDDDHTGPSRSERREATPANNHSTPLAFSGRFLSNYGVV